MINIKSDDIQNYEFISKGNYGSIFRVGDKAYKLYHTYIKDNYGIKYKNPELENQRIKLFKVKHLMKLNKKIKSTDLISDTIYVDNRFKGVVLPYYDGEILNLLLNSPYNTKKTISKQLIDNTRELMKNNIYPADYKLNNMMFSDGKLRIIDLDDRETKLFFTPFNYDSTMCGLIKTIIEFMQDSYYTTFNKDKVEQYISFKNPNRIISFRGLRTYLDEKDKKKNIIFINNDINIDLLKRISNSRNRIIYVMSSFDQDTIENIKALKGEGTEIFDITYEEEKKNYLNNYNIDNSYDIKENKVLRFVPEIK